MNIHSDDEGAKRRAAPGVNSSAWSPEKETLPADGPQA